MIRHAGAALLAVALLLAAPPVRAAELRVGVAVDPDSIDPHFYNFGGNKGFMPNLFEALTTTDLQDDLVPNVALSWRLVDASTWEFTLRPGVTLSDGTLLTADDVAFALRRVPNVPPPSPTSPNT